MKRRERPRERSRGVVGGSLRVHTPYEGVREGEKGNKKKNNS